MEETLRQRGASLWFLQKALSTPPSSMWYPTQKELIDAGVVTKIVDANQFALSGTGSLWKDPAASRSAVEAALQTIPVWQAIKQIEPALYDKAVGEMTRGVTEGRSVVDVQHETFNLISTELLPKYLKSGRGAEPVDYWKVQIEELRYFSQANPQACVGSLFPELRGPTWDSTRLLPAELQQRDLAALTSLLRAGTDDRLTKASSSPTDKELSELLQRTAKIVPDASTILQNPKNFVKQPDLLCSAFVAFYTQVLATPSDRATVLFRYFGMNG